MGLLDLLSGVTDFFSGGPDVIDYAPSDFGFTFEPISIDPSIVSGASGGGVALPYDPSAYTDFMIDPDVLSGVSGGSAISAAVPISTGGFDFALSPAQQQSINDAISGMTRGALQSGRSGGGVALNTLLNLPPAEVPDVPKVTVPSLEGPPPPPAGAEPLPFKPLAVETTTPAQAPRALDRLAGTVPPETFPESRALDARRRLRV